MGDFIIFYTSKFLFEYVKLKVKRNQIHIE